MVGDVDSQELVGLCANIPVLGFGLDHGVELAWACLLHFETSGIGRDRDSSPLKDLVGKSLHLGLVCHFSLELGWL